MNNNKRPPSPEEKRRKSKKPLPFPFKKGPPYKWWRGNPFRATNIPMVVIEIGDSCIKIAKTSPRLPEQFTFECKEYRPEEIPPHLERLLETYTQEKTKTEIVLSLPRAFFVSRYLELPSENEDEIRKMLPFQLAKNLPYSLEEILYDFTVVKKQEGTSKVLVFILQKKKINPLLAILKGKKEHMVDITMSSIGLQSWVQLQKTFLKKELTGTIVVLDIDKTIAEFIVTDGVTLFFSRSFPVSNTDGLSQELKRSFMALQREFTDLEISSVVVTNTTASGELAADSYRQILTPYAVTFLDPLQNIACSPQTKEASKETGSSLTSLMGLIIHPFTHYLHFLPQFLKERKEKLLGKKRVRDIILISSQLALIIVIMLFTIYYRNYSLLQSLNEQLQEFKLQAKGLDDTLERIKIIERQQKDKIFFSELIANFPDSLPQGSYLTSLEFDSDGGVAIKGYAQKPSDVFDMVLSLNQSPLFKDTKVEYANRRKHKGRIVTEFYITGKVD